MRKTIFVPFFLVLLVLLQVCNHHNIHSRRAISLYTHALCKVACPCGGYETSANAVAHYSPCTYLVAAPFSAQLRIFLLLLRRLEEKKCVSIPCCKLPASLAIKMNTYVYLKGETEKGKKTKQKNKQRQIKEINQQTRKEISCCSSTGVMAMVQVCRICALYLLPFTLSPTCP